MVQGRRYLDHPSSTGCFYGLTFPQSEAQEAQDEDLERFEVLKWFVKVPTIIYMEVTWALYMVRLNFCYDPYCYPYHTKYD